jgi:hypothetical protein
LSISCLCAARSFHASVVEMSAGASSHETSGTPCATVILVGAVVTLELRPVLALDARLASSGAMGRGGGEGERADQYKGRGALFIGSFRENLRVRGIGVVLGARWFGASAIGVGSSSKRSIDRVRTAAMGLRRRRRVLCRRESSPIGKEKKMSSLGVTAHAGRSHTRPSNKRVTLVEGGVIYRFEGGGGSGRRRRAVRAFAGG